MATASTIDDICEWQLTKNTVSERIKHIYRNPLMADVHFTVTDGQGTSSPQVKIPCHKFILAVSSPVFYTMFYGELKEPSDYIDLPDCDSEGLLEFLRFIYCDEVELTGSCVIQVLYLAKKYMIPSLANRCRSFLEANINAENVLDLLPVLEKMEQIHLNDVCWKVIDTCTAKVLESAPDEILEDNNLLLSILKRDTLDVEELTVFQAVNRWAENIETEVIEIFLHFSLNQNPRKLSCIPRHLNSRNLLRCKRISTSSPLETELRAYDEFTESTSFSVNVPIFLGGITICGFERGKYTVKLKLNCKVVFEGCFLTENQWGLRDGFDVIFEQYHLINPNIPCILEASIKGQHFYFSRCHNKKELVYEKVRFRFGGPRFQSEFICINEILFRPFKNN